LGDWQNLPSPQLIEKNQSLKPLTFRKTTSHFYRKIFTPPLVNACAVLSENVVETLVSPVVFMVIFVNASLEPQCHVSVAQFDCSRQNRRGNYSGTHAPIASRSPTSPTRLI
jgi:hypothetical protein